MRWFLERGIELLTSLLIRFYSDGWLRATYTGRQFCFANLEKNDIVIEDIAHALSNICRFAGHSLSFYSVAQHAVLVSHIVEKEYNRPDLAFAALNHDNTEAYLHDVTTGLKSLLPGYKMIEDRLALVIAKKLCYQKNMYHPLIKKADLSALALEAKTLLNTTNLGLYQRENPPGVVTTDVFDTYPLRNIAARQCFLHRFKELQNVEGKNR